MTSLYNKFPSAAFPTFIVVLLLLIELGSQIFGAPNAQAISTYFESVYRYNPLLIVFVGAMLETIFMLSLYLPGSFVIFLAVYFSNGSIKELSLVALMSCIGVFSGLIVNYLIGRFGIAKLFNFMGAESALSSMRSFFARAGGKTATFLAGAHPNFLGIAMVTNGMAKTRPATALGIGAASILFWVPLMIFVASLITEGLQQSADNAPYLLITIFLAWSIFGALYDLYQRHKGRRQTE